MNPSRSFGQRQLARSMRLRLAALVLGTAIVVAACSSGSSASGPTTTRVGSSTTVVGPTTSGSTSTTVPTAPAGIATDAFLAGFPLVTTERTMQTFAGLLGVNKLFRTSKLSTDQSRFIVGPNHDTLYDLAVLDLRVGPQVVTVPKIENRYYTLQFIDAWMDTVGYIGTRATHSEAGTWVVVPKGYAGKLPAGAHSIVSPTNQLIMLGRVRAIDGPDVARAYAATATLNVESLAQFEGQPPSASVSMAKPAGSIQAVGQNGIGYFDELDNDLALNPPVTPALRAVFGRAASLGIVAGRHPSVTARGKDRAVLAAAVAIGNRAVASTGRTGGTLVNGWQVNLTLGEPNTSLSLLATAQVARHFWGPNVAAEAVYPTAVTASDGQPLTGAKHYVIHLAANDLPPVKAFWSYTVYGPDSFLVANPINRFSISGQTPGLVRGAGGSIDIYLSHDPPKGHEANWLPTPAGPFRLAMRLYLPGPAVLDGTYRYPPVTVAQ